METAKKAILKHLNAELAKDTPDLKKLEAYGALLTAITSAESMSPPSS